MVDNVELNPGTGGDTIATDDDGTAQHQYMKVEYGPDNTQTKVTATNGLPIQGDGTDLPVTLDGEAVVLGAGSASIGKIGANDGVDIGDVDVTSVIPGTGATNLGKAIDSVVGSTDTGIALLGKHTEDQVHTTTADSDYEIVELDSLGNVHVNPESHHIFDELDATTGWTVLGNDTTNLTLDTNHQIGTGSLRFDKVDGAANTVIAGIQKTVTSTDLGKVSPQNIIQTMVYLPSVADVDYIFARLGDSTGTNYNEWRISGADLPAATWEVLAFVVGDADFVGSTGNGWDSTAITYVALGVALNAETDTLANILFDQLSYHTSSHATASLNSEVSSSVSSPNVNLQKVGGSATDKGAGNASNGSQRVVIATDDVNQAAIKTAVEIIDDAFGVADDAASSGSPVFIGALAKETDGTDPTSVSAEDDRTGLISDRNRRLFVNTAHPNLWSASENHSSAQTNNALQGAPGANLSLYITDIIISNGATAGNIKIVEDTSGTPVDRVEVMYFAANGGMSKRFATPIRIAANIDVGFTSVNCTTHSVTLSGYIAP